VGEPIVPFDFSRLTREKLADRGGKVSVRDFAKPVRGDATFEDWWASLPRILAGRELRELVEAIVAARTVGRPVHLAMGGHVVKVGLGPVLADLIERQVITAVSVNGAFLIHDFEVAAVGFTSEDVDATLGSGRFGVSEATGQAFADIVDRAAEATTGLGNAAAEFLATNDLPHADASVLAACHRAGVPVTIHVAVGTDVVHLHPALHAARLGTALMHDFGVFTTLVSRLGGGVFVNIGSAVLMPEVFLKALTAVRNTGTAVEDMTCANLDFIRHYRPLTNVVTRPVAQSGRGINLVGHHEIMVPLIAAAVIRQLWSPAEDE